MLPTACVPSAWSAKVLGVDSVWELKLSSTDGEKKCKKQQFVQMTFPCNALYYASIYFLTLYMFACYKYSFWNICNLAISHISSLIDGNVLFCFLNFLSLLNLASTFDSELQLREGIYLPTQLNMPHFPTCYTL